MSGREREIAITGETAGETVGDSRREREREREQERVEESGKEYIDNLHKMLYFYGI